MTEEPPRFYEPPNAELDAAVEHLRAEERDWNARVEKERDAIAPMPAAPQRD